MAFLAQLWLPVVLSAAAVFVLSAATHMLLPWRRKEWGRVGPEDALRSVLAGLPPGQYGFPAMPDAKEQRAEWTALWARGPTGWLVVATPGPMSMGRMLAQTFGVYVVVSGLIAYVASLSLGPATPALTIVRVVSTVGVLAHGVGTVFNSIWYHRPWRVYAMDLLDAFLYAFATAGVFAALWPR